jgi:hypothetical protein
MLLSQSDGWRIWHEWETGAVCTGFWWGDLMEREATCKT